MENEGRIIAKMMDSTRDLSLLYLQRLSEVDLYKRFEWEHGVTLNSVYWLVGHMAATQNFLVLHNGGTEKVPIPWARQFGIGSSGNPPEDQPSFEEVFQTLQKVHSKSIEFVSGLTTEQLNQPTINGFRFGTDDDSIRSSVFHSIRHEGGHAGQLSWLCKLHGLQLI